MLRPRELKFISILLGLTGLLLLAGGLFNAYQSSLRPWLTGVPYENSGATLAAVRRRGHLRCGVEGSLRGFSVIEGTSIFEEHGRKFFANARAASCEEDALSAQFHALFPSGSYYLIKTSSSAMVG